MTALSTAAPRTKREPYDPAFPENRAHNLLALRWTVQIISALRNGPVRFVNLQREGPTRGVSTEQLRSVLNVMLDNGLVTKTRYRQVPPRVDYELTDLGREALVVVDALATWGRSL